jgi:hypothetical protein
MSDSRFAARSVVRSLIAAAVLLVAGATSSEAQVTMRFDSTGKALGFQNTTDVGPAYATILDSPGMPGRNEGLIVNCVDISNNALYGQTWTAWFTSIGGTSPSLDHTRQGALFTDALDRYRKAAWLIDQYSLSPMGEYAGIQGAIWMQFKTSLFPFSPTPTEQAAVDGWMTQANNFASSAAFSTYDFSKFVVITDTTGVGQVAGGAQEFMAVIEGQATVTPEPATMALFATGLVTLGAVSLRRRGRNA